MHEVIWRQYTLERCGQLLVCNVFIFNTVCWCSAGTCPTARRRLDTGRQSHRCAAAVSRRPGGRSRHDREQWGWELCIFKLPMTTMMTVLVHRLPVERYRRHSTSTMVQCHEPKQHVLMMTMSKRVSCTNGRRTCLSKTPPPVRVLSFIKAMFIAVQSIVIYLFTTNVKITIKIEITLLTWKNINPWTILDAKSLSVSCLKFAEVNLMLRLNLLSELKSATSSG